MLVEIFIIFVALIAWLYVKITRNYDYWKKRGIPFVEPTFPFGNFNETTLLRKHTMKMFKEHYQRFKDQKIYGIFNKGAPILVVNDPELAKIILVKDFNHFVDRSSEETSKLIFGGGGLDMLWTKQLTQLTGNAWKEVRSTFSPIFTSRKMKIMFKFIDNISKNLLEEFDKATAIEEGVELKEIFGKFSMDTIASCAFGVDAESFTNRESKFVQNATRISQLKLSDIVKSMSMVMIPGCARFCRYFNISMFRGKETKFFATVIRQTIKNRLENKIRRNDLIDLMMDAMKDGSMDIDENEADQYESDMKLTHTNKIKELDETMIIATAMILMTAGYDTTGMQMSYIAYELAKNQHVQEKLQQEIDDAYEENGGATPSYNTIQNMEYLDMVIHEGLRLHPVITLQRYCLDEYTIPGTNVTMTKGQSVYINNPGIQTDPKYFLHPEVFNPENFSKEAKAGRSPYTFLTFGQGPRACIGMRFALLEAKIGLMTTLRNFSFLRCEKTQETLQLDPQSYLGYAKGGVWVKVVKRNNIDTYRCII